MKILKTFLIISTLVGSIFVTSITQTLANTDTTPQGVVNTKNITATFTNDTPISPETLKVVANIQITSSGLNGTAKILFYVTNDQNSLSAPDRSKGRYLIGHEVPLTNGSATTSMAISFSPYFSGTNYLACYITYDYNTLYPCRKPGGTTQIQSHTVSYSGQTHVVYRFWSPTLNRHFYTISESEKNYVIATYPGVWNYERMAFVAKKPLDNGTCFNTSSTYQYKPVYRFWSPVLNGHFYTISESEKDYVIATYPNVWNYERVAYCAIETIDEFRTMSSSNGYSPLHRFWSPVLNGHFYTASESEKNYVIATYPNVWNYERIAYFVEDFDQIIAFGLGM